MRVAMAILGEGDIPGQLYLTDQSGIGSEKIQGISVNPARLHLTHGIHTRRSYCIAWYHSSAQRT
jgi:hypothetical protein